MATNGLTVNASAFLRGLRLADARASQAAKRGMAKVLLHTERLAKEAAPVESGTLAGTIVADPRDIEVSPQAIVGTITAGGGEASDYAIVQHEMPLRHSHPHSGVYASKYVEGPLQQVAPKAGQVIAAEVRRAL